MTILEAINRYVDWVRARGVRFVGSAYALLRFARSVGDEVGCDSVTNDQAAAILTRPGPSSGSLAMAHAGRATSEGCTAGGGAQNRSRASVR